MKAQVGSERSSFWDLMLNMMAVVGLGMYGSPSMVIMNFNTRFQYGLSF